MFQKSLPQQRRVHTTFGFLISTTLTNYARLQIRKRGPRKARGKHTPHLNPGTDRDQCQRLQIADEFGEQLGQLFAADAGHFDDLGDLDRLQRIRQTNVGHHRECDRS